MLYTCKLHRYCEIYSINLDASNASLRFAVNITPKLHEMFFIGKSPDSPKDAQLVCKIYGKYM